MAHTDHRTPADYQVIEEFDLQRPRNGREAACGGNIGRAGVRGAGRMIVRQHEAGGAELENPLQQGAVAAADRRGIAQRARVRQQPPLCVVQEFDHDFPAQAADVPYQGLEERPREWPDDASTRDQFCHEGSLPRRLSLTMCRTVPSSSAVSTTKVGVPRISA